MNRGPKKAGIPGTFDAVVRAWAGRNRLTVAGAHRLAEELFGHIANEAWMRGRVRLPEIGDLVVVKRAAKRVRLPNGSWVDRPSFDQVVLRGRNTRRA